MLKRALSTGILAFFLIGLNACENEAPIDRTDENIQNNEIEQSLGLAELAVVPHALHAEIAALNRAAGFGDPAAKRAPLGRWPKAAAKWLAGKPPGLYGMNDVLGL